MSERRFIARICEAELVANRDHAGQRLEAFLTIQVDDRETPQRYGRLIAAIDTGSWTAERHFAELRWLCDVYGFLDVERLEEAEGTVVYAYVNEIGKVTRLERLPFDGGRQLQLWEE